MINQVFPSLRIKETPCEKAAYFSLKIVVVASAAILSISILALSGPILPQLSFFMTTFAFMGIQGQLISIAFSTIFMSVSLVALCVRVRKFEKRVLEISAPVPKQIISEVSFIQRNPEAPAGESQLIGKGSQLEDRIDIIRDEQDVEVLEPISDEDSLIASQLSSSKQNGMIRSQLSMGLQSSTLSEKVRGDLEFLVSPLVAAHNQDSEIDPEVIAALQSQEGNDPLNLFSYLCNLPKGMEDRTLVAFQAGVITQSMKDSRETYIGMLKNTYGSRLADSVIGRYSLNQKPLTWKLLKESLVGIAANVTDEDFKTLFESLKNNLGLGCLIYLSPKEKALICEAESFDDLNPKQLELIENVFRTLPKENRRHPTLDVLFEGIAPGLGVFAFYNFNHDAQFLKMQESYEYDPEHIDYAAAEHISKVLAYLEMATGMIQPLLEGGEAAAQKVYYKVAVELKDKGDGVLCHILAPINHSQFAKDAPVTVHVNFRGTQIQPAQKASGASVIRDTDPTGVGHLAFKKRVPELIQMITFVLNEAKGRKVELKIHGHSLGGADLQRLVCEIVKHMAKQSENSTFDQIYSIAAISHNSPAIEVRPNEKFAAALKNLEEKGSELCVDLTYIFFHTDPVHNGGTIFLGGGVESKMLKKRIILFSSEHVTGFAAHSARAFTDAENKRNFKMEKIDDSKHDLLEKYLMKEGYSSIAIPLIRVAQATTYLFLSGLHSLGYYTIGTRKGPQNARRITVNN